MPEQTINAQCPDCGHIDYDSWEIFSGDDGDGAECMHDCPDCGMEYKVILHINILYTTKLIKQDIKQEVLKKE